MKSKGDDFVVIYKEDFSLCNSKGVNNGKAIALYCKIKAMAKQNGFCEASNPYFADFLTCSTRQISRYLTDLEQAKLISVQFKKNGNYIIDRKIVPTYDKVVIQYDNIGSSNQKCQADNLVIQYDTSGSSNQNCHTSIYSDTPLDIAKGDEIVKTTKNTDIPLEKVNKTHIFNIIKKYGLNPILIKNMILLLNQNLKEINNNPNVSGNYNFSEEEFNLLQKMAMEGDLK